MCTAGKKRHVRSHVKEYDVTATDPRPLSTKDGSIQRRPVSLPSDMEAAMEWCCVAAVSWFWWYAGALLTAGSFGAVPGSEIVAALGGTVGNPAPGAMGACQGRLSSITSSDSTIVRDRPLSITSIGHPM